MDESSFDLISTFTNLESFTYSGTTGLGLSTFDFLSDLENLETIVIDMSNIGSMPTDMSNMQALSKIVITNASLITIDTLSTLPNKGLLTEIDFNNNSIYDLTALTDFSNLSTINLEDNKIETEKNTAVHGDVLNAKILDDLNMAYKAVNNKNITLYIENNKLDDSGKALLSWAASV